VETTKDGEKAPTVRQAPRSDGGYADRAAAERSKAVETADRHIRRPPIDEGLQGYIARNVLPHN
jgi:hypothetical protein